MSAASSGGGSDKEKEEKDDKQQPRHQSTDTDELKRFREKWKRELTIHPSVPPPSSSSAPSSTTTPSLPLHSTTSSSHPSSLDHLKHNNTAYPRSHIGENRLISRFLVLLEEAELREYEEKGEKEEKEKQEEKPTPIFVLPPELQLAIFANLDVKTLENCSVVCRFWYILARDEGLPQFQTLCLKTWAGITTSIFESYQCDWRTMYLHRPRLRDDGIYISRNYYLRPGQTEGSYYQPVHEVVYFRYLRFFENGTVIYALSSDAPKQVLNWFKPINPLAPISSHSSHRAVHSGTYILDGSVVQVWVKISATHTTCLELKVDSSKVGRNDRLSLVEYKCVHDENDVERIDVAIKKFHFAKLPKQYLQDTQITSDVQ